jgi:hypothetical protein
MAFYLVGLTVHEEDDLYAACGDSCVGRLDLAARHGVINRESVLLRTTV